jgi:5-formyltetrahydrofolate cyclo-ligase
VVAAYASVGTEPPTRRLLEALGAAARVVVPVVSGAELGWGDLVSWSELLPAPSGLLAPPRTSDDAADAAAGADLILVPALAVDRQGHRLGRGGGFYDRWLPERADGQVVAVVYDDELFDAVPHEPHDRRVDAALTPAGLVRVGQ